MSEQPANAAAGLLRRVLGVVNSMLSFALVAAVRVYQYTFSPLLGPTCRYEPSCSAYFIASVRKYGPWVGGWRGLRRIARCHPWGGSGYDPP